MSNIPITVGTGTASVATETVGGISYQQIEVYGAGGASTLSIAPDGSLKVSVVGTIGVSVIGVVPVTFAASSNQSVSGTVGASVIGTVPIIIVGGSVATATTNSSVMLLNGANVIGSVTTLQGTNPWIITGSVQGAFSPSGNQSVSGTVGASIIGQLPAGNAIIGGVAASISGTVAVTQSGAWTTSVVGGPITPYAPSASLVSGVTSIITTTSQTSVLATAPGAQRNYITNILVTNAGLVGTQVNIIDGTNVIYAGYAAASGGGFAATFPAPLKQATLAQSVDVKAVTTTSISAAITGFTAA